MGMFLGAAGAVGAAALCPVSRHGVSPRRGADRNVAATARHGVAAIHQVLRRRPSHGTPATHCPGHRGVGQRTGPTSYNFKLNSKLKSLTKLKSRPSGDSTESVPAGGEQHRRHQQVGPRRF